MTERSNRFEDTFLPPDVLSRIKLTWTQGFPVLLLVFLVLYLVQFYLSYRFWDYGLLYLQTGLIFSSLLHVVYEHHRHQQLKIRLTAWIIIPLILYMVSMIFHDGLEPETGLESDYTTFRMGFLVAVLVWYAGNILWIVLRIRFLTLTYSNYAGHLLVALCAMMVLLFTVSLTQVSAIYYNQFEDWFQIEVSLYISLGVVLYALVRLLLQYLNGHAGPPEDLEQGELGPFKQSTVDRTGYTIDQREMMAIALKIDHAFEQSKIHLDNTVSLDMLAAHTEVSKHKLTLVLHNFYHKGFYRLVGEYRIRYAMELLKEDQQLSLEALSERCGFNSKSSFYKYFKALNGCTPQEYLQHRSDQSPHWSVTE